MTDKITIKEETAAIDMGAKDLWDSFTEDQKKQISSYLLIRYASSIKTTDSDAQALAVFKTNEYYNKNYFNISKHPKLLWYLVCMCGNDEKKIYFHEWIGYKKKEGDKASKITKFLESRYPNMKRDEIEMMAQTMDKKDVTALAKDLGMTDDEIKKII